MLMVNISLSAPSFKTVNRFCQPTAVLTAKLKRDTVLETKATLKFDQYTGKDTVVEATLTVINTRVKTQ